MHQLRYSKLIQTFVDFVKASKNRFVGTDLVVEGEVRAFTTHHLDLLKPIWEQLRTTGADGSQLFQIERDQVPNQMLKFVGLAKS